MVQRKQGKLPQPLAIIVREEKFRGMSSQLPNRKKKGNSRQHTHSKPDPELRSWSTWGDSRSWSSFARKWFPAMDQRIKGQDVRHKMLTKCPLPPGAKKPLRLPQRLQAFHFGNTLQFMVTAPSSGVVMSFRHWLIRHNKPWALSWSS